MSTPAKPIDPQVLKTSAPLRELHIRVPAKINLFLHVTGRRDDGYHLLESIFCPIDLCDDLHIRLNENPGVRLIGGLDDVDPDKDLSVRAARAFLEAANAEGAAFRAFGHLNCGVELTLGKRIPVGAGLGGGSADAAFTLMGLNHLAGNALSDSTLASLAVRLGADVPFFLLGQAAFVSGIGEVLQPLELPELALVVIKPPAHMPTQRIFSDPDLTRNAAGVKMSVFGFSDALQLLAFVSEHTANRLQPVAVKHCPDIQRALYMLQTLPEHLRASWVRMTGSGSAVFGVYESEAVAKAAANVLSEQLANKAFKNSSSENGAQAASETWFLWQGRTLSRAHLNNQLVQV